jgi:hypothetical protein
MHHANSVTQTYCSLILCLHGNTFLHTSGSRVWQFRTDDADHYRAFASFSSCGSSRLEEEMDTSLGDSVSQQPPRRGGSNFSRRYAVQPHEENTEITTT